MGWTLVTKSAKQMRRMVQIFVKVDGMRTVAMEVSPEDKVQKILNTVSGSDWDVYVTCGGRILRKDDKLKSCGFETGAQRRSRAECEVVEHTRTRKVKKRRSGVQVQ